MVSRGGRRPGLILEAGVRWVARTGPDSLAAEVAGGDLGGFQVWAAGETGSLKGLRPVLRDRLGASRRTAHVQAYWIEGRAMGTARKSA
ncbi:SIP domain-containing protein [Rothia santali]|uniref:SIP domain-containing protein n=1 Tax=Rothia santali TaxID=2949643 RepID=UPI0035A140B4